MQHLRLPAGTVVLCLCLLFLDLAGGGGGGDSGGGGGGSNGLAHTLGDAGQGVAGSCGRCAMPRLFVSRRPVFLKSKVHLALRGLGVSVLAAVRGALTLLKKRQV